MKYKILKKFLDIFFSFILLILLIPIFIIIAILIKLDTKGEIIFKHKRYGKDLNIIYVYKFRTMVKNAESLGGQSTEKNDIRITKIGNILRKLSLDELPQLINILKGEMSFIGPRPDSYEDEVDNILKRRSKVLPGITGLAQVNGRSSISIEKRAELDVFYAENVSLKLDIMILLKTIKALYKIKNIT